jgi:FkbM family methyltransferase
LVDPTPASLTIPGLDLPLRMRVHRRRDVYISEAIRSTGIWEPFETALMQRSLQPGHKVLDAGANIGYFTLLAAACVGDAGQVYAFEPEPRNFALLEGNVALNHFGGRVRCCRAALSDRAGESQLFLSEDNLGDHQLHAEEAGRQAVRVKLEVGGRWFAGREDHLDFVKIDTQGSEHAVLQGLMPLLRASGCRLRLLVELTPRSLRAAGSSGAQLIDGLAQLRLPFYIVDHLEHRLVPSGASELATWCNNVDSCPEDAGFMNIFLGSAV